MKELSIEGKATLYDQAIKLAKSKIKNDKNHVLYEDDIIEIFPELKESKGEGIRKALLEMVHDTTGDSLWVDYNVHKEDAIAWLEKQGEQKHVFDVEIPFGTDSELVEETITIPDGCYAIIEDNKVILRKGEHKSAEWSEDDQSNFNELSSFILETYRTEDASRLITWLNDIKDRVLPQSKQEWSEEDEVMLDSIIEEVRYIGDFPDYPTKEENELYNECLAKVEWLKSLKDKVLPQKPEWSEEDESHLKSIESTIEYCKREVAENEEARYLFNEDLNWLKSLIPQPQWKPSDEQMDILCKVSTYGVLASSVRDVLQSLYNDLKKL